MGIKTNKWPARSPDLNPIENLWSILSSLVYANGKQYRTREELTQAILCGWDLIGQHHLEALTIQCQSGASK